MQLLLQLLLALINLSYKIKSLIILIQMFSKDIIEIVHLLLFLFFLNCSSHRIHIIILKLELSIGIPCVELLMLLILLILILLELLIEFFTL